MKEFRDNFDQLRFVAGRCGFHEILESARQQAVVRVNRLEIDNQNVSPIPTKSFSTAIN
jgi:hypothetical protein